MAEYPPLPRVPDLGLPPAVCVAWVDAAVHEDIIDALCGESESTWCWPAAGELTTGPSNPVPKQEAPCLCRYGLRPVQGVPGTHPLDPFGHYTRARGVYAFRIHPRCPHHGDAALAEAAYWMVLDEQERGDH